MLLINLQWTKRKLGIYYPEAYVAKIWQKQTITISDNGEDWFSMEMFDQYGNETHIQIPGGETLEIAKQNVNTWIQEQLQTIL